MYMIKSVLDLLVIVFLVAHIIVLSMIPTLRLGLPKGILVGAALMASMALLAYRLLFGSGLLFPYILLWFLFHWPILFKYKKLVEARGDE
jgi:hypothetical protein